MAIGGLHIQYYNICMRKLWLYSKQLGLEEGYSAVESGQILHEQSYKNDNQREILIDGSFKLDIVDGKFLREVKSSKAMRKADYYQILFYLYELKKRGFELKGKLSYPRQKKIEVVELTEKLAIEIEMQIKGIENILSLNKPPKPINSPICKKCAYYDFCYAGEV